METKVEAKEFQAKLPTYLEAISPIAITQDGETIGYYVPVRRHQDQAELTALTEVAAKMNAMLTEDGVSDDDIVAEFEALRKMKP